MSGPPQFIAYKITHVESGKAYIGITTKPLLRRWRQHIAQLPHRRTALGAAIRKYGEAAFDLSVVASAFDRPSLMDIERALIVQERTLSPHGYNLTSGGEGVVGVADEVRKRLSDANRGKPKSAEHRAKIKAYSPQRLTPEVRKKISDKLRGRPNGWMPPPHVLAAGKARFEAMRGRTLSVEHKAAISRAHTGLKRDPSVGRKIAASKIGKPRSAETRAKVSVGRLAYFAAKRAAESAEQGELFQ